jgi:hypothetical protein
VGESKVTLEWLAKVRICVAVRILLATFAIAIAACGNGSSSGTVSPVYSAPFSKDEGDVISGQKVTTYSTATTGPSSATQPGLDSFYAQLICTSLNQQECDSNTANLNTPQFGNFDLSKNPIGDNPLGIKAIDAVKIDYNAINVDQSVVQVSGGIAVPELGPRSLKGIILYFHGTTVQRSHVPSTFTATNNISNYTDSILMAAILASQGYIVVMPDYVGLGDDAAHAHPYVAYPGENAQSGLAMLKAARAYLKTAYHVNRKLPLFITGYSEGGAYALEAAHLMQKNPRYASALNVRLREVAPISGFFDLSGTGLPYLFDNISKTNNQWFSLDPAISALSKPYLSAYLVLSFAAYSGISPTDILASSFYNCPQGTTECGASNNLDGLYFTAPQSAQYDTVVLTLAYALATLTGWSTSENAVTPLMTQTYANGLINRDMANPLYSQIVSADTYLFTPKFPVDLISLMQDSVVTRKNTDVAYNYFAGHRPHGPYKEDLVDNSLFLAKGIATVGPIDHTTELPFLIVLVLNEFETAK